ncbi:MAG: NAD(P)/FAD-dependent oxidoreductase [Halobacteriota archaeon]|nr:NAD(P)/FAD-dependent oxidoreductase [Halobacteriota archaeon]
MKYDVIVVGGGPGGAIAAKTCAKEGLKTLLLEKKEFLREKACAGGVTEKVIRRFDDIPQDVFERYYYGLTFCVDDEADTIDSDKRLGGLVCRGKFDSTLVKMAEMEGAETKEEKKVIDIVKKDDFSKGVIVKTEEGTEEFCSDIIIGADGQSSMVRRKLGAFVEDWTKVAAQFQYQMKMPSDLIDERIGDRLETYLGEDISPTAYAWIFPKRDIVTVGIGALVSEIRSDNINLKDRLDNLIKNHPVASKKLEGAKIIMTQGHRITYPGSTSRSYFNGAMLIGEAAGHALMGTGEGIYYAMAGGEIAGRWAAKAISAGDVSEDYLRGYEDAWKAEFGEDLEWAVNLRRSQKRPQGVLKMMLRTIERSPAMKELLFDYMDGRLVHVLKEIGFIK